MKVSENEEEFVDTYENLEVNEAEEEFIDRYDDSDDENELALSDHSSDEDEITIAKVGEGVGEGAKVEMEGVVVVMYPDSVTKKMQIVIMVAEAGEGVGA
uniref:Uncharacterized protein n=1 Tax=Tanacetum cinerariifolium TaxID=118510 RepID=A0A699SKV5_TANCI|nr:hypothetical protein [Tanacetum cinerariifolium]GFC98240.1 hypothetical protein [Tanacetum cinerariifolium]